MLSPYITHITLSTGHASRSDRSSVDDATLVVLRSWLQRLVDTGATESLPVAALSNFAAHATVGHGALLVTLLGPAGPHTPGRPAAARIPMITIGVAQRSRQSAELWPLMVEQFGARAGLPPPPSPWLAVAVHPSSAAYRGDIGWLADFEQCVAWAWITRNPAIGVVSG